MSICEPDKKAWQLSYNDSVDTIRRNNPTITSHEIRIQAALLFRPRYRSDVASIQRETSNVNEYDSESAFTMTDDGRMVFTNSGYNGVSVEDFSLNQLRLTPEKYSLSDHQTSLAIQEAFRNGATTVVSSYYREGDDNRDILVMNYNKATRKGTIRVINTAAKEGKSNVFTQLTDIAKQHFPSYHEVRPTDGVFILSDVKLHEHCIRQVVQKLEIGYSLVKKSSAHRIISDIARTTEEHVMQVTRNTVDRVASYAQFVYTKNKTTNEEAKILKREDKEKRQYRLFERIMKKKDLFALTKEPQKKSGEKRTLSQIWRETAQRVLHVTEKESIRIEEFVKKTWKAAIETENGIFIAADSGIAIGGALVLLESLRTMEFDTLFNFSQEKIEEAAKEIVIKKDGIAIVHVKPIEHLIDIVTQQSEEEMSQYTDELVVLTWLKEFIPSLDKKTPQQAIAKIEGEQIRVAENVQLLSEVIKETVHEEIKVTHHAVREFSVAVMAWMILKYVSYYERLESVKKAVICASLKDVVTSKSHLSEAIAPQESATSWLLFAIIWYLAMIREQGAIRASGAKYQAKQAKKQTFQNPLFVNVPIRQYAVIYPS